MSVYEINSHKRYRATTRVAWGLLILTIFFWALVIFSIFGSIWIDWRWIPTGLIAAFIGAAFYHATDKVMDELKEAEPYYGKNADHE